MQCETHGNLIVWLSGSGLLIQHWCHIMVMACSHPQNHRDCSKCGYQLSVKAIWYPLSMPSQSGDVEVIQRYMHAISVRGVMTLAADHKGQCLPAYRANLGKLSFNVFAQLKVIWVPAMFQALCYIYVLCLKAWARRCGSCYPGVYLRHWPIRIIQEASGS